MIAVQNGYAVFMDEDGKPIDEGYVYIGEVGLNPITNPEPVYWDRALTIVAAQPIRTRGGYALYNGSPGQLYTFASYSLLVQNKYRATLYYQEIGRGLHTDQSLLTTDDVVFNQVTAPDFIGDLTGDVLGDVVGDVTGDLTGNADTATSVTGIIETGTGAEVLHCKVVEIGDWNMDTVVQVDVAHGIANGQSKIRSIQAWIRFDDDSYRYNLCWIGSTGTLGGAVNRINDTEVQLLRVTTGIFDNTGFDATSFNRGHMIIWYAD